MNKRLVGVILLMGIAVLMLSMLQEETKVTASQVVKNVREFDLGEKIIIYETPQLLSAEEIEALEKYALVEFFQDDLPADYLQTADQQNEILQRDLLAEQEATPQQTGNLSELAIKTPLANQSEFITGVTASELTASRTEPRLIESNVNENVYIRGSIVKIAGKVDMERPKPYFLNVNITCCDMTSFRAITAHETDAFGNFLIKFATTPRFPLGDWTVTISTIGDDQKIIKHFYNFKLLAPPV